RVPKELVLRVRGLGEGVELERDFPCARVRVELTRLLRLLDRVLQVREPGANHAFDAITHRPWTVVVFERGRSEEAATGEDLPLRVADHMVTERPDSCQSFRRTAGRIDDLGDEELGRVLDGRQL